MISTERLLLASSLVLYKYTEGREDWNEWTDVADALETVVESDRHNCHMCQYAKGVAMRRVDEFRERLAAHLSRLGITDAEL